MKRTTVELDDEVDAQAKQEAARRELALSDWVRDAVVAHLPSGPATEAHRRIFRAAGAGASGRSDISSRIGELAAGMAGEADQGTPAENGR